MNDLFTAIESLGVSTTLTHSTFTLPSKQWSSIAYGEFSGERVFVVVSFSNSG